MRSLFAVSALAGMLAVFSGCDSWKFSATRTESLSAAVPEGSLLVNSSNGKITVEGGDVDQIEITAAVTAFGPTQEDADDYLEEITLELDDTDEGLLLYAEGPVGFRGKVEYTITAPRNVPLNIDTGNGTVNVRGMESTLELESSNGTIDVAGARDTIDAKTSNGRIKLRADVPVQVNAKTSNGSMEFVGALRGTDNTLKTSNGKVSVQLWGNPVEVTASTSNGKVNVDGESRGKSYDGKMGGESGDRAALSIRTSNGQITLNSISKPAEEEVETEATDSPSEETGQEAGGEKAIT